MTSPIVHRFNRYEIKYLVPQHELSALRAKLDGRMRADAHQTPASRITSLYYDTSGLRFYWEKMEGLRFRRKLRIRAYGPVDQLTDESMVFVEIKQRVNRVTQKRRVRVPFAAARMLCDGRTRPVAGEGHAGVIDEVLTLVVAFDLRPTAITTYLRQGYVGQGADLGLRVTLDLLVAGRVRDLSLSENATNRFSVPPDVAVVEVKADDRVPTWFTDLAAETNLSTVRLSKYCKTIDACATGMRGGAYRRENPASNPKAGER